MEWLLLSKDSKGTRYLPHLDFDENDEVTPHFAPVPVVEHQKLTGPVLDPGDILGAACEVERLAREKYGSSFDGLSFNAKLALIERERHNICRRRAALKVMGWIRKRPAYRPSPSPRFPRVESASMPPGVPAAPQRLPPEAEAMTAAKASQTHQVPPPGQG